jgi:hypothetical protein
MKNKSKLQLTFRIAGIDVFFRHQMAFPGNLSGKKPFVTFSPQ